MQVVSKTDIKELPLISRGKVRDIYQVSDDSLLIVTTDRMSAFDVVLPDPIPFKGVVLNQITLFWMDMFKDLVQNHILVSDFKDFPESLKKYPELNGRSVIVRKARPLPIECIVRGYITGSGWKDYQRTGKVSGHVLPEGLLESEMLPDPLFTPSTKADIGEHDENITIHQAQAKIGEGLFDKVQELSLEIYKRARDYARNRGIIIADTKFEFGLSGRELLLIDEVLTPDSSRFWPMEGYAAGRSQPSFDKQFLRDWLVSSGWDKTPPGPVLPEDVVQKTSEKYREAYRMFTDKDLPIPKSD
ncbi:MAG: phosphoribosylaminoimidazolesuccinocarboxamide synthase [Desulfovibrionales bacterium]